MPIISPVERRTLKGRSLLSLIYLLLVVGGITMVYPFMLMVRLSTADAVDQKRLDPVPMFWWSRDDLAKKFLLRRYSSGDPKVSVPDTVAPSGADWTTSNFAELPNFWNTYFAPLCAASTAGQDTQISDYEEFLATLEPIHYVVVDWDVDPGFRTYRSFVAEKSGLNKDQQSLIYLVKPDATIRDWHPRPDRSYDLSVRYAEWAKPSFRRPLLPAWTLFLKSKYGQFEVSKLNAAHGTAYQSWTEVAFPLDPPTRPAVRTDYDDFLRSQFPHMWIRLRGDFGPAWTRFLLSDKRIRTPRQWLALTGLQTDSIEAIPLTAEKPKNEAWSALWSEFVHAKVPVEARDLRSPDRLYVEFLRRRYPDIAAVNRAWDTRLGSWGDVRFAASLSDARTILDHGRQIKSAMTFDPFRVAARQLGSQSRALLNTLVLMVLALFTALTVNPLAAYALSRFRIRGTHKILLFILATMALPAEIAMVPSFLLVRDLGLMNNYLALILPGAASAFGIFLLKGFFDSLPPELYEAATLDGAPELTIFLRITMPLATPILAVTGMGAVLGAYGTFVPAILYLQDPNLWPLMPRLFEMAGRSDSEVTYAVNMAALVISSIPTLLVFLVAQRQIMRGIIIPTFK